MKNLSPLHFYIVSIVSLVLANICRDKVVSLYYIFLLIGVVFFVFGLFRRVKSRK